MKFQRIKKLIAISPMSCQLKVKMVLTPNTQLAYQISLKMKFLIVFISTTTRAEGRVSFAIFSCHKETVFSDLGLKMIINLNLEIDVYLDWVFLRHEKVKAEILLLYRTTRTNDESFIFNSLQIFQF